MQPRTKRQIRIVVAATLVSAALGAVFTRRSPDWTAATLAVGVVTGALCGVVLPTFEFLVTRSAALRRLPLLVELALRTVGYGAVFVAAIHAAAALVGAWGVPLPPDAGVATRPALLFSTLAALAFNLVFMLRAMLGPGAILSLLVGRYRRPREERRIVLFLDLRGSTGLAERMGDVAFLGFLNRITYDITDPILAAGGEIYRYVGDGSSSPGARTARAGPLPSPACSRSPTCWRGAARTTSASSAPHRSCARRSTPVRWCSARWATSSARS